MPTESPPAPVTASAFAGGGPAVRETHIPVLPKRLARAQFASQLYQHLPAVLTVLAAGVSAIQSEREGGAVALAVVELVVGGWVLFTIAQEARHLFRRRTPSRAGDASHATHDAHDAHASAWIDTPGLAAAALGYVEVWHHAHEVGHFKLVSPYMLGATATLFLALGGRRLIANRMRHRRPHLRVTTTTVTYRGGRRRRWTADWADVASVEDGPGTVTFRMRDGRAHALREDEHLNGGALLAAARAAVAEHAPAHVAADRAAPGAGPHAPGSSPEHALSRP